MLNLFPIPVLDGGHLVAFAIEAIRGRPPSPAVMQVAMSIGLGLILLLMVFATYNDIMRMVS
jgi:regulator of sigma E protease